MKRFIRIMCTWTGDPADWAIVAGIAGFAILYFVT
jgi:hypothetical protein